MHILILPFNYPSPEQPVKYTYVHDQATALQKAGHEVRVLVTPEMHSLRNLLDNPRWSNLSRRQRSYQLEGIPVDRGSQWAWLSNVPSLLKAQLIARETELLFRGYLAAHGKPDLIHAHNVRYGGWAAAAIRKKYRLPVVLTEHSTVFLRNAIPPLEKRLIPVTLRSVDRRLAVGPALAAALQSFCQGLQIEVVPNIVHTGFFTPSEKLLPEEPFVFSSVAQLKPIKAMDNLIRAFALAFKGKQAVLNIGGFGDERSRLETLAHELGMAEQVNFPGKLSRDGVRALLRESHVLVSASSVETFGVTLIEAMACGRPVIATRSGGPELFVNDGNGILVPVNDVNALATAMQAMRNNYRQYDPGRIRDECVVRFGEQAIVERLEAIYEDTLKQWAIHYS